MKLVFASSNKNKIAEIQAMLPPHFKILSLEDIGCTEEIPETADTIEGNAILKADYVTEKYGYDCFADDSGLEVSALDGAPGVYSARYAGEQKNAMDNMQKLLEALATENDRSAQFKTVLALNLNNEKHLFPGILRGTITNTMRGTNGFGYDPIFQPEGYERNLAEFTMEEKAAISHRGIAVKQLVSFLEALQKP
ncbi:MAG: non-canonical purine NTP pyrophosphatase [Flavobacterium sp. BFFFF1]|uniref:non-canonical purine NTP diphosphatase n=1 Tax=unclassified Flavobacterium TaxID=196869 RepID=UPI000BD0D8F5|nr:MULTISPECIES: non-canonical purine NTP diphosphatase [unclassified Flavobacterium]OYU79310.1 MAG: non-canonical purine NTP pyrophosphatase [Flavobacterium sp. BFFFF1]